MSPSLECGVDADCHANGHRAKTPSLHTLSLTEYSANPSSPPNERTQEPPKFENLPADFLLPNGYPDYLRLILTSKVYDVIDISPMTYAANLSSKLDCRVMLKREDLLPVFSFKLRGAYNKMAHLDPLQTYKGVVACSAGKASSKCVRIFADNIKETMLRVLLSLPENLRFLRPLSCQKALPALNIRMSHGWAEMLSYMAWISMKQRKNAVDYKWNMVSSISRPSMIRTSSLDREQLGWRSYNSVREI